MPSYSLYDATIPIAQSALKSLSTILTKAEEHPDSSALLAARLIEDMKPLRFQIHYATFQSLSLAATLSGQNDPLAEPDEVELDSFAAMQARIRQALDALGELKREAVNSRGEGVTLFTRREKTEKAEVKAVVGLVNLPNIFFHVSMAYAILRKEGVPVGKRDWSRGFVGGYV